MEEVCMLKSRKILNLRALDSRELPGISKTSDQIVEYKNCIHISCISDVEQVMGYP